MYRFILAVLFFLVPVTANAQDVPLRISHVGGGEGEGVYALIGELDQRSPTNFGNNATFGAIVTADGVVLIDPGGSAKGAAMLETAVQTVTDKPIIAVINTGGQDHRWLGNDYFKNKGARIIASAAAVADQQERVGDQLTGLEFFMGAEGLSGTKPVHAHETFEDALDLEIGGVQIQLRHPGGAHTPGDAFVWLPETRIVFSGDIVYMDRMLAVNDYSDSAAWIQAFQAMAAFDPKIVVPGHGDPAPLDKARAQTLDYLKNLRHKIGQVIDNGGVIEQATAVDQSSFAELYNFSQLAKRNAQQVFIHMEFE